MKITKISVVLICLFVFSGCAQIGAGPAGGQKEKDCLLEVGSSWCESKQKCLRQWDEPCDDTKDVDGTKVCQTDSDCIPHPSKCHPHSCINKKNAFMFKPPENCTELFDCSAAYEPQDCLCQDGQCVNGNEGKNCR